MPLFSSIAEICPNPYGLEIAPCQSGATRLQIPVLERLICTLHHLESLIIPLEITPDVVRHLGYLPRIQKLGIPDCGPDVISLPVRGIFRPSLGQSTQLRRFGFTTCSLERAADVIDSLQCYMEQLKVTIQATDHSLSSPASLTRSFPRHRCTSSLTSLRLLGSAVATLEPETPDAVPMAFRSLFSLRSLQTLEVMFEWTTMLDNDWFAGAAMAWPRLQSLTLSLNNFSGLAKVALAGLIPLIRDCPRLSTLELSLAAKPFDPDLLSPGINNTKVTHLDLGRSSIVDPLDVFRCLMLMFPRLESLFADGFDYEQSEAWATVIGLVNERNPGYSS